MVSRYFKILEQKELEVLKIKEGGIYLKGYDTGFIGGCGGMVEQKILGTSGDLKSIYDYENIKDFLRNRNIYAENKIKVFSDKTYEDIRVGDFALTSFEINTPIHKSEQERMRYFKANQKRVAINGKKCKGCGICVKNCPAKALTMKYDKNGELYTVVDYNKCIFCYNCVATCPYKVVEVVQPISYKKLQKEIEKHNDN